MPHAEYAAADTAWRHYLGRQLAPAFYTILRNMFTELSSAGAAAADVLVDEVLPNIDDWSVRQLAQLVADVQRDVPKIKRIYKEACTARAAMIASTQQAAAGKLKFTCPKLDTFLHEAFATAADELSYEQAAALGSPRRKDRRRLEQAIATQVSAVMADCIDLTTILRHADAADAAREAQADEAVDTHINVPVERGGTQVELEDASAAPEPEAAPEAAPEAEPEADATLEASDSGDDDDDSDSAGAEPEASAVSAAHEADESQQPSLESSEDSIEDEVSALIERVRQRGTQRVKRQVRLVK